MSSKIVYIKQKSKNTKEGSYCLVNTIIVKTIRLVFALSV